MAIELTPLPFNLTDLEPFISDETLQFHYQKHHQGYIEKLNQLIKSTYYDKLLLEEIIFESAQNPSENKIFNNAAQAWNHSFYWNCLTPQPPLEPSSDFSKILEKHFGTVKGFIDQLTQSCEDLFGSGWVWLVKDSEDKLSLMPLQNAENPILLGKTPLLVCDIWEHAYYLDHQNRRDLYIQNFLKLLNWDFVEKNFEKSPVIYHTTPSPTTIGFYH